MAIVINSKRFKLLYSILRSKHFEHKFQLTPSFFDNIQGVTDYMVSYGIKNIKYISNPIIEACDYDEVVSEKLLALRHEIQHSTRCFIYRVLDSSVTVFVQFERQEDKIVFFVFGSSEEDNKERRYNTVFFTSGYFLFSDNDPHKFYIGDFSYYFINDIKSGREYYFNKKDTDEVLVDTISFLCQLEVFLQYAKVETKILKEHHNDFNGVKCKYHNKLPSTIEIIDSSWYTTLVKSDSFNVRGHFRLQPFGVKMSDRKLIWINPYQKNGYIRKAKIIV